MALVDGDGENEELFIQFGQLEGLSQKILRERERARVTHFSIFVGCLLKSQGNRSDFHELKGGAFAS